MPNAGWSISRRATTGYEHLNSPTVKLSVGNNMFYAFALSPDAAKHIEVDMAQVAW